MKILHICTMVTPGAGGAALRLHLGLKSIGLESKVLFSDCDSSDSDVVRIKQPNDIFSSLRNKIRNKAIFSEMNAYKNTRPRGLDLFTDDRTKYSVSKHPFVKEADIINLHWIANMIDYNEFFSNIRNKPIVWTLHDRNPITGGCHVPGECTKYQTGCGICPQLGSNDPNDLSRRVFVRKEKAYKGCNISVVASSKHLADSVKKSLLFKNFPIHNIPHGLPINIFKKRNKQSSRKLLGLPQDKVLILFGAYYLTKNKGFAYLREALKLLEKKLDLSKIALVTFGPKQDLDVVFKDMRLPMHQLGYIEDQALLSSLYSGCDMSIIPSLEEAFGQICLESMASGTPVIGFNTGAMIDMINPYKTGLIAELKNKEDLASKIEYMITHPKERQEMGENSRKLIEQEYTLQTQAKRYFKLYEMMLSKKCTLI